MRPFVAEHLDGLRLTKIAVELDHEPLIPPKALAQDRFREPGSSNDHGKGWRTSIPKARQNRLKLAPARAVHEGVGARGTGVAIRSAGQGSAVTAEHRSRPLYGLRARLCVRRSGACAASFHPPSLALLLARATPLWQAEKGTQLISPEMSCVPFSSRMNRVATRQLRHRLLLTHRRDRDLRLEAHAVRLPLRSHNPLPFL